MAYSRRRFLTGASATTAALWGSRVSGELPEAAILGYAPRQPLRRFQFVQVDVFTSQRLRGNQLSVFTDARGLSDSEMQDLAGRVFGEMRQPDPVFGPVHDRDTVAAVLGLKASDIAADVPTQTVSTGLPFAIVPIKQLSTLRSLCLDLHKVYEYLERQQPKCEFYYITRERMTRR